MKKVYFLFSYFLLIIFPTNSNYFYTLSTPLKKFSTLMQDNCPTLILSGAVGTAFSSLMFKSIPLWMKITSCSTVTFIALTVWDKKWNPDNAWKAAIRINDFPCTERFLLVAYLKEYFNTWNIRSLDVQIKAAQPLLDYMARQKSLGNDDMESILNQWEAIVDGSLVEEND